ncbi:MAG: copper amine oxidase N-terminal domain-containing protein [Clostridia bacterium]|nr:copper amine oxidase N-terminal domain-containing protein [Clostridia bacterium]
MKKNLITLMAAVAILASSTAAFADEIPMTDLTEAQEVTATQTAAPEDDEKYVMPVSEEGENIGAPVSIPSYISNTVTVTEVGEGKIATTLNKEDAENPENTVNYTILENTLVFNSKGEKKEVKDIEKDADITVFTNSYSPAPLIMPPQYQADVIIINDGEEIGSVNVDTYIADGERLINAANSLVLNIGETTEIVDKDGKEVKADELKNKDLVVFYTITTRSIPAQTTPEKVVVLGENETALAQIAAAQNVTAETPTPAPVETPEISSATAVVVGNKTVTNIYSKDDVLMVPLREIAEELGFTVEWDGNLRAVILNGGMYSLKIGENSYVKGKMMPVELKAAPEIKDDLTYVPVEYFTEVLEAAENIEIVND